MKTICTYIKVGYLLHLITVLEIVLLYFFWHDQQFKQWLSNDGMYLKHCLLIMVLTMPLFAQLDARSRYQDYKLLCDQFYTYGFEPRIVNLFIQSRCQRDAVFAAAETLDLVHDCKTYFRQKGYKWHHVFPAFLFTSPAIFLCPRFWLTTLFTKTYKAKVTSEMIRHKKQYAYKHSFT